MTVTWTAEAHDDACLAYANTLSWRGRATPIENLRVPADLLRWLRANVGLDRAVAAAVEEWGRTHAAAASDLLAEAIALREALFRMFAALARRELPAARDLAAVNRALDLAPTRRRIAPCETGYGWRLERRPISASSLLAPVLWSAGDLLAGDRRDRVRLCANEECLWLFLDESKAGTRRWCDMASCGNRAKARRHYERTRPGRG